MPNMYQEVSTSTPDRTARAPPCIRRLPHAPSIRRHLANATSIRHVLSLEAELPLQSHAQQPPTVNRQHSTIHVTNFERRPSDPPPAHRQQATHPLHATMIVTAPHRTTPHPPALPLLRRLHLDVDHHEAGRQNPPRDPRHLARPQAAGRRRPRLGERGVAWPSTKPVAI